MLVYIQNKDVEFFGTKGFWKREFGRTVKEDARPYIILLPFGPCGLAYDIYDTEGLESPEYIIQKGIQGGVFQVEGHVKDWVLEHVYNTAKSWKIPIRDEFLRFNYGGYIKADIYSEAAPVIVLHEKATDEEHLKTIMHELGHLFLGHLGNRVLTRAIRTKNGEKKIETIKIKGRKFIGHSMREIEAETVSYLICSRLFLDTRAAEYLSAHLDESTMAKVDYQYIIKVADTIEKYFLKNSLEKELIIN